MACAIYDVVLVVASLTILCSYIFHCLLINATGVGYNVYTILYGMA